MEWTSNSGTSFSYTGRTIVVSEFADPRPEERSDEYYYGIKCYDVQSLRSGTNCVGCVNLMKLGGSVIFYINTSIKTRIRIWIEPCKYIWRQCTGRRSFPRSNESWGVPLALVFNPLGIRWKHRRSLYISPFWIKYFFCNFLRCVFLFGVPLCKCVVDYPWCVNGQNERHRNISSNIN